MDLFRDFDEWDEWDELEGIEFIDFEDDFNFEDVEESFVHNPYTDGGDGFVKWCNDFVYVNLYEDGQSVWKSLNSLDDSVHPISGKRMDALWINQQEVCRQALKMEGGRFIYSLIVLCWMRGEGKSLVVCLIQLWKFFNFKKQTIVLGANSKDQTKFVHYDIMRDIILNSPKLLNIVGKRNVQEKEIILRDRAGRRVSSIRSITTSSGIVSNIAGYTFSEMFDMKNPKFFIQLDGSIRNIPNALGTIDSTVSSKEHILYKLYLNYKTQSDPKIFFSHRCSIGPDYKDFWHPEMTEQSLKSYEVKFPAREFAMYFKNTWDAGSMKMFPAHVVDSFKYIGFGGVYGEFSKICSVCKNEDSAEKPLLMPISVLYSLKDEYGYPKGCDEHELARLEDFYDTNFAILVGIDRADPMKLDLTTGARTIITIIAKGLPGSRSNLNMFLDDNEHKNYLYFLLNLIHVQTSDMETIKQRLEDVYGVYGSIETLCTERWGMWDFGTWCEKREIFFEAISPSYDRQKDGFSELFNICCTGRFKSPQVYVKGSKKDDILEEEFKLFDHAEELKFYGSPEKSEKYGTQDDVMYSLCWGIYGGRFFDVRDFPSRNKSGFFGAFIPDTSRRAGMPVLA